MQKLLALHGHTLNGAVMRRELAFLEERGVELICPDAPNPCDDAMVDRLYAIWDGPRQPAPHRSWWFASDDGRSYRGWEATRDQLFPILASGSIGILGFSQGAILATALAAMSESGELPPIPFVIPIAGRAPRSDVFTPLLTKPLATPSLHIWGEADHMARDTSRELVDSYAASTRRVVTWSGAHTIPQAGAAADAIVQRVLD